MRSEEVGHAVAVGLDDDRLRLDALDLVLVALLGGLLGAGHVVLATDLIVLAVQDQNLRKMNALIRKISNCYLGDARNLELVLVRRLDRFGDEHNVHPAVAVKVRGRRGQNVLAVDGALQTVVPTG